MSVANDSAVRISCMEGERVKQKRFCVNRRNFLKMGSLAVASVALALRAGEASAQGAPPRLDEKDPLAQNLGYTHDAQKVDRQKFAKYQSGQVCSKCQFYLGSPSETWGPCQIYPGKLVNSKGWCSAYVGKG